MLRMLAQRVGAGGKKVTYMEGHDVYETANTIFGYNGWASNIIDVTVDYCEQDKGSWSIGVTAIVRITVLSRHEEGGSSPYHEDLGFSTLQGKNKGEVMGRAKKAAVTDAKKRALRCFTADSRGLFHQQ